jgi:hypothetical protein
MVQKCGEWGWGSGTEIGELLEGEGGICLCSSFSFVFFFVQYTLHFSLLYSNGAHVTFFLHGGCGREVILNGQKTVYHVNMGNIGCI